MSRAKPLTRRLSGDERKAPIFNARQYGHEPALGSLDERLGIIIRAHGGSTGPVRMTARERREYEAWLASEGLAS